MIGIPLFLAGVIMFIVGILKLNIVIVVIGALLMIAADNAIQASKERMNNGDTK